jgi:hypothetical protein
MPKRSLFIWPALALVLIGLGLFFGWEHLNELRLDRMPWVQPASDLTARPSGKPSFVAAPHEELDDVSWEEPEAEDVKGPEHVVGPPDKEEEGVAGEEKPYERKWLNLPSLAPLCDVI